MPAGDQKTDVWRGTGKYRQGASAQGALEHAGALPGRFDRLSIVLYVVIGWSGIVAWESIAQLPSLTLVLITAGGLLYTIGVVFHVWQNLPFQNAIWHAFVLVDSSCFYGAVFQAYVLA